MGLRRALILLGLIGLLLPAPGGAQQSGTPKPPDLDSEAIGRMHPLEAIIYRKEMMEEYRKEQERQRRLREMEAWDNQRRLVKRQLLDVHCTWKRPSGKTITKVFKQRVASSCKDALADLSRDLKRPLTADCSCTGASPTEESP